MGGGGHQALGDHHAAAQMSGSVALSVVGGQTNRYRVRDRRDIHRLTAHNLGIDLTGCGGGICRFSWGCCKDPLKLEMEEKEIMYFLNYLNYFQFFII